MSEDKQAIYEQADMDNGVGYGDDPALLGVNPQTGFMTSRTHSGATSLRSSNGRTTSSPTAYSTPQSPTASTTPAKSEPLINGSSSSQSPCRRRASQELILAAYIYV